MPGTPLWIVGGEGRIGRRVAGLCGERGVPFLASSRKNPAASPGAYVDLALPPEEAWIPPGGGTLLLCAAINRLADCEADPEGSRRVNVEHTAALARMAAARGWRPLFLSTSAVFDGTRERPDEAAEPSPQTAYGRQKAETERLLLAQGGGAGVVRLTKVLAPDDRLFLSWAETLGGGERITPFHDLFFAPVPLDLVAGTLIDLAQSDFEGILHVSGDRDLSYADAALILARRLNAASLVAPVSWEGRLANPPRGPHAALGTRRPGLLPPIDAAAALDALFSRTDFSPA